MTKLLAAALAVTALATATSGMAAEPFKTMLDLQGISFAVEATNEGSIN